MRRRWERLPIAIPVFVRGSDETGRKFVEFATAANINAGGMLLMTKHPMPAGLVVTLEIPTPTPFFQVPGHPSKGAITATVLYENYSEGFHLCGMAFAEPLLDESKA
ncbi:MAG TPA: PilZ domain-containing protein [Terriglobia bacterium]|nr:PilZ domain-containing protein [Terriglobia bacterium]